MMRGSLRLLTGVFAALCALRAAGQWQAPPPATTTRRAEGASLVTVVDATRKGVVALQGYGLASIAGDEDNFGYGGGWTPPLSCETFDNRGPEDLGVFDQREPIPGQYNSICSFVGSWSQTIPSLPGGVAQFTVMMRILGGSTSVAYCAFSPCGCTTPTPQLLINGVAQDGFFADPGCAEITYWTKTFQGAEAASLAAAGTLNFEVRWNNQPFALDWSKVQDVLPNVNIALLDGDGQKGVLKNAVEKPLRVKLSTLDPSFSLSGLPVTFKVASTPPHSSGAAIGVNDRATTTTFTATTDSNGVAAAVLVLGDTQGSYTVQATTPLNTTNQTVTFSATAQKPASVALLKDTTDLADNATAYAVAKDQATTFFTVGLDASGQKIGPIKCNWSTQAGGNPSTRGSGTVDTTSDPSSSSVFTPGSVGQLVLAANPAISGVNTAKAYLYITSLYVSVDNTFSLANPVDQRTQFVPGQYLDGTNVALDVMSVAGQFITLHVLTGAGAKGHVTFALDPSTVSHYPGVAMNYPLQNPDTGPDMAFAQSTAPLALAPSVDVPFSTSGDTFATLVIRDFAAQGALTVRISAGKNTFTLPPLHLPVDNGTGLPAAGWTAGGGVHVDSTGLAATGDEDAAGGSAGSDAEVTGDGLSNYEEYRGFVTAGTYTRLDPRVKDIFIDLDPDFLLHGTAASPVQALTTLTPRIHYLDPTEVRGVDQPSRGLLRTNAVAAFNRASVPIAHPRAQRALRLVYQTNLYPAYHLAAAGIDVPVWEIGFLGATLSEDMLDIDLLNAPGNVGTIASPMRTQFSEEYTRTFTNLAVNTTFSYPYHYDANGSIVPQCTFQGQSNCDVWDTANNLIVPELQNDAWGILYTVPDPGHDPVEHYSLRAHNCGSDAVILGGLNSLQMELLKGYIAAHELGHAMHMDHLKNFAMDCSDLMFDTEDTTTPRKAMSGYIPQPTGFSSKDQVMIRLWEP